MGKNNRHQQHREPVVAEPQVEAAPTPLEQAIDLVKGTEPEADAPEVKTKSEKKSACEVHPKFSKFKGVN